MPAFAHAASQPRRGSSGGGPASPYFRRRPAMPLFTGVAGYARGILERDARALLAAADVLQSSSRPLLYAAAAEDAGGELANIDHPDEALDQLNAAFDTYVHYEALADARRVGRALRGLGVE